MTRGAARATDRWRPRRRARSLGAVFLAVAAVGSLAPSAGASIYFATSSGHTSYRIERAAEDGLRHFNTDPFVIGTERAACGLALHGRYLFYAIEDRIGRIDLEGQPVKGEPNFITGLSEPCGVATDSSHIYWDEGRHYGGDGSVWANSIARANLDGSGVERDFIFPAEGAGQGESCGIAVSGGHLYWGLNPYVYSGSIARADVDGSAVDRRWIDGEVDPEALSACGIAVEAGFVFWAGVYDGTVNRATLDGGDVKTIAGGLTDSTTGLEPLQVATRDGHVYWTDAAAGAIGRAKLDGSGVDHRFVEGVVEPRGVAVDGRVIDYDLGLGSGAGDEGPQPGQHRGASSRRDPKLRLRVRVRGTRVKVRLVRRRGAVGRVVAFARRTKPRPVRRRIRLRGHGRRRRASLRLSAGRWTIVARFVPSAGCHWATERKRRRIVIGGGRA